MSHPEETHHPAVGVRWGVTAAGPLLFSPLSIFSRPAHCWNGEMRGQGGHRGRGGQRGRWRRWRRGGAGGGAGGAVPLRGQGCRWLQRVVQKVPRVGSLGFGGLQIWPPKSPSDPHEIGSGETQSLRSFPEGEAAALRRFNARSDAAETIRGLQAVQHEGRFSSSRQRQLWTRGQEETTPTCPTVRVWPPEPRAGKLSDTDASTLLPASCKVNTLPPQTASL